VFLREEYALSSLRVKFIRGEEVKYISHLDMMKVFERAIRRSKLPIAYSQGFNPHPAMVFGLPLSVGVTSESEYADFEFTCDIDPQEFSQKLNQNLPEGIRISLSNKKQTKVNIMASIVVADYEILVATAEKQEHGHIKSVLDSIMEKPEILIEKESKRGRKEVDIRPMIFELKTKFSKELGSDNNFESENGFQYIENPFLTNYINKHLDVPGFSSYNVENVFSISLKISAGSKSNLKPDLLISAFNLLSDLQLKLVKVHRTGLYIEKEMRILDPLSNEALS